MTREYALIGLVVGIIIGAVAMRFGNRNCASSRRCSSNWKRIKPSLKSTVKSWSAILRAAPSCWITWRTTTASCISIWRKALTTCCRIPWQTPTRSATARKSLKPATIRRRSRCRATTPKAHPDYCAVAQNAIKQSPLIKYSPGAPIAPAPSPLPGYNLNQSPHCYLRKNSITSGYSGHFSIHLRLREPASNEETDFAVECVSVKHWVIVVGSASGSSILTDSGARPARYQARRRCWKRSCRR